MGRNMIFLGSGGLVTGIAKTEDEMIIDLILCCTAMFIIPFVIIFGGYAICFILQWFGLIPIYKGPGCPK